MEAAGAELEDPWQRLVMLIDRGIDASVPVWWMLLEPWAAATDLRELTTPA